MKKGEERVIEMLVQKAKTDHKVVRYMKELAVEVQDYELASLLRNMERENFPEKIVDNKDPDVLKASAIRIALGLCKLKTDDRGAFIIMKVVQKYFKRKGNMDMKDAIAISTEADEKFKTNE